MSFAAYLVSLAFVGVIVGPLARLSLPGRDPMTLGQTIAIGEVSAFTAGIAMWELTDGAAVAGIPACTLVGTGIVYLVRRRRGGHLTHPGRPPRS
jgi:uncharacterized membrane protein YeaQ/YmgE (transglycosylase-associated protein family)